MNPHPTFTENTEAHGGLAICPGTPASYGGAGTKATDFSFQLSLP